MAAVTLWNCQRLRVAELVVCVVLGFSLFGSCTVDADVFVVKSSAY